MKVVVVTTLRLYLHDWAVLIDIYFLRERPTST